MHTPAASLHLRPPASRPATPLTTAHAPGPLPAPAPPYVTPHLRPPHPTSPLTCARPIPQHPSPALVRVICTRDEVRGKVELALCGMCARQVVRSVAALHAAAERRPALATMAALDLPPSPHRHHDILQSVVVGLEHLQQRPHNVHTMSTPRGYGGLGGHARTTGTLAVRLLHAQKKIYS
eukprot:354212-Chlamydomonas_euryale.AAC.22